MSRMSSESSWGIIGIFRKLKEFRVGLSSEARSEFRGDFEVVTCGVRGWAINA